MFAQIKKVLQEHQQLHEVKSKTDAVRMVESYERLVKYRLTRVGFNEAVNSFMQEINESPKMQLKPRFTQLTEKNIQRIMAGTTTLFEVVNEAKSEDSEVTPKVGMKVFFEDKGYIIINLLDEDGTKITIIDEDGGTKDVLFSKVTPAIGFDQDGKEGPVKESKDEDELEDDEDEEEITESDDELEDDEEEEELTESDDEEDDEEEELTESDDELEFLEALSEAATEQLGKNVTLDEALQAYNEGELKIKEGRLGAAVGSVIAGPIGAAIGAGSKNKLKTKTGTINTKNVEYFVDGDGNKHYNTRFKSKDKFKAAAKDAKAPIKKASVKEGRVGAAIGAAGGAIAGAATPVGALAGAAIGGAIGAGSKKESKKNVKEGSAALSQIEPSTIAVGDEVLWQGQPATIKSIINGDMVSVINGEGLEKVVSVGELAAPVSEDYNFTNTFATDGTDLKSEDDSEETVEVEDPSVSQDQELDDSTDETDGKELEDNVNMADAEDTEEDSSVTTPDIELDGKETEPVIEAVTEAEDEVPKADGESLLDPEDDSDGTEFDITDADSKRNTDVKESEVPEPNKESLLDPDDDSDGTELDGDTAADSSETPTVAKPAEETDGTEGDGADKKVKELAEAKKSKKKAVKEEDEEPVEDVEDKEPVEDDLKEAKVALKTLFSVYNFMSEDTLQEQFDNIFGEVKGSKMLGEAKKQGLVQVMEGICIKSQKLIG